MLSFSYRPYSDILNTVVLALARRLGTFAIKIEAKMHKTVRLSDLILSPVIQSWWHRCFRHWVHVHVHGYDSDVAHAVYYPHRSPPKR